MGGILVGVLAAVREAHQIQDLIIVVLPVCPVQAQSMLSIFGITSEKRKIGMTGLTSYAGPVEAQKIAAFGSACMGLRTRVGAAKAAIF